MLSALVAAAPAHAAGPVVLDPVRPVDVAVLGTVAAAWLRPLDARGVRTALVIRDYDGTVRVMPQRMPDHADSVALADDASRDTTVVIGTRSSAAHPADQAPRGLRGALYRVPFGSRAPLRRLPVSTPGSDLAAPGLLKGRLTFARRERLREGVRWTVRKGALRSSRSRVVSRGAAGGTVPRTTPTARGTVAYVTSTPDRATGGATLALRHLVPGGRSAVLSTTTSGDASESGYGPLTISPEGGVLFASRWTAGGSRPHDLQRFALPSRALVAATTTASSTERLLPFEYGPTGRVELGPVTGVLRFGAEDPAGAGLALQPLG